MLEKEKEEKIQERETILRERVPPLQLSGLSVQDLQVCAVHCRGQCLIHLTAIMVPCWCHLDAISVPHKTNHAKYKNLGLQYYKVRKDLNAE